MPHPEMKPVPTTSTDQLRVFISYARDDDKALGFVSDFKRSLHSFVKMKSSRVIDAFLDTEDINWGQTWEETLDLEIMRATIFIPFLSANYISRTNCRNEFIQFKQKQEDLGVSGLILPIVLIDAPQVINNESTDSVVAAASKIQLERFNDAALQGPGTAEWRTTMDRLAGRFVTSLEAAEETINRLEKQKPTSAPDEELQDTSSAVLEPPQDDDIDEDTPGFLEIVQSLETDTTLMTGVAHDLRQAVEDLGYAATSAGQPNPDPRQVQAWSLRVAHDLKEPSEKIESVGTELFEIASRTHRNMTDLRALINSLPEDSAARSGYKEMVQKFEGMDGVREQLEGLLNSFRQAEAFSVPMRKALRPARRGLTRVTDSLSLMKSWSES